MSYLAKPCRVLLPFLACCLSAVSGSVSQAKPGRSQPNPHPVAITTPTPIGAYLAPALPGWSKEVGQWPPFSVVYYRRAAGDTRLLAKIVRIPAPADRKPLGLGREKAQIEAGLSSGDAATGERSRLLTSRMVQFQGEPAIYLVRVVRGKGQTTRVKSLIFNEGTDQYQVTVYAHSLSQEVLQMADQGWQQLTAGLQKRA